MPQETNLNVAPYYDDFDAANNFHRVLFKPGTPVQARELTGLQSILQNQIDAFGTHMFKEGDKVIPGQLFYLDNFRGICIEDSFQGIPVSLYLTELLGKRIRGESSGVEARIEYVLRSDGSDRNQTTLYYTPTKSGSDLSTDLFEEGENLLLLESISYGNTTISQNQSFASAISLEANIKGSAANIQEGVYFLRGNFVRVSEQTILLNQYDALPTLKLGLAVQEEIISSSTDASLNDNAQGFSNYSAPGADRLKITATLVSRAIESIQDESSFVELMRLQNGEIETFVKNTDYNYVRAEFARRTFDESGDYYIRPFGISLKNTLNNLEGNSGLYNSQDTTFQGNAPSDDLMEYVISPGKAYVRGFEIDKQTDTVVDIAKPRSVKSLVDQTVPISVGPAIRINNTHGAPVVGFNTTLTASLRDERVGVGSTTAAGTAIGACRVYDYNLESQTYEDDTSEYTLRLYDIVPYTQLQITQAFTTLGAGAYIEGQYSGASGFVAEAASGNETFSLQQVRGNFHKGEKLSVDGVKYNTTVAISTNFDISNVKSIYQGTATGITTFNADLKLSTKNKFNTPLVISGRSGTNPGISTINAPKGTFVGIVTANDLVRFISSETVDPKLLKVQSIGLAGTTMTLAGIETVTGINDGAVPQYTQTLTDIEVVSGDLINVEDNTLYTTLDNRFIDSVDLTGANLVIRRTFDNISVAQSGLTLPTAGANEFYQAYDEERYNVAYSNGTVQSLSSDMVDVSLNSKVVTIQGLDKESDTNVRVSSTLTKNVVTEKKKQLQTVSSLLVSRSSNTASGIGSTTLGDGLTHSTVYGTRVQDKEISLNKPDVLKVVAVYESDDANDPTIPTLTLTGVDGPSQTTSDFIIGERIIGSNSKATALIVSAVNSTKIEITYLNEKKFIPNETITGEKSGINGLTQTIGLADKIITSDFTLDNGQRKSFYDYGRLVRKKGQAEPKNKLRIIFQNFTVSASDTGDIYTSESFDDDLYSRSIPTFEGVRNTDIIDIRPVVGDYDTTSTTSPFDFNSRAFNQSGQAVSNILVSDENIIISYDYYLGRTDRVFLDGFGQFNIIQGVPSENPQPPSDLDGTMPVATIKLPPYLFSLNAAEIQRVEHKRYRMQDISDLDSRITNLEYYTALSLLEKETEALTIQDARGLDRFKSGFFTDNFTTHLIQDQTNPDFSASIDTAKSQLRPSHHTTGLDLVVATTAIAGIGTSLAATADSRFNGNLIDPNLRRTGDVVTLNYAELTYMQNLFASRVESVNPFLVTSWVGTLNCFPSSDIWCNEQLLKVHEYDVNSPDFEAIKAKLGIGEKWGFGSIEWGSWEDYVTGRETRVTDETVVNSTRQQISQTDDKQTTTTQVVRTTSDVEIRQQKKIGISYRNLGPHIETEVIGNKVISRNALTFMRSRNIELRGTRMKPRTQVYPVIDNVNLAEYLTPKLLEIQMVNGTFEVGETVVGSMTQTTPTVDTVIDPSSATLKVRVAAASHREGPFNSPTKQYAFNPYEITQPMPETYSSASTLLNVDTGALAEQVQGDYFGYANSGMVLRGLTSGAQATIQQVRLVTDEIGTVAGTIFVPDATQPSVPQFTTGSKTIKLTSLPNVTFISALNTTSAETIFQAAGVLDFNGDMVSLRPSGPQQATFTDSKSVDTILSTSQAVISEVTEDTILRNVRQRPAANCDARYVAYTTAINNGYGSYTAYARANGHYEANRIYDTPWLLTQPGAPTDCGARSSRGGRGGRSRRSYRRRSGRRGGSRRGGRTWNFDTRGRLIPTANLGRTTTAYTSRSSSGRGSRRWSSRSVGRRGSNNRGGRYSYSRGGRGGGRRGCGNQRDPLAQSFYVNQAEGIFTTSIDCYFQAKDNDLPVTMQIRTMRNGTPTKTVVPFSEVSLQPSEVLISDDASEATTFTFNSPVYLEGNHEYAVVLLADTPEYGVWISRMGERDLTNSIIDPDAPRNLISQQPLLGSLFKSQNASTWSPSQFEDLKFVMKRAQFTTDVTANLSFYNPPLSLGNDGIAKLGASPVETISQQAVVGLGTTLHAAQESIVIPGLRMSQKGNTTATGVVVNTYGAIGIGASVDIINSGIGYTPSAGFGTYSANLVTKSGSGSGAVASVTVNAGSITSCFVTNGGIGYAVGDEVGVTTLGNSTLGRNARFSVGILSAINGIKLDEVQGIFNTGTGAGTSLTYINQSTGATTDLTTHAAHYVKADSVTTENDSDGLHLKVTNRNYGMYSASNVVKLNNIASDLIPTSISADVDKDSTSNISLASTANLTTFENVGVGTTNAGYVLINGELISYTGVSGNSLEGISRNIDNTGSYTHNSGDQVSKYELNGISLRRINNKSFTLGDATISNPRELDTFNIKIDTSETTEGIDRSVNTSFPKLYFNSTKKTGGSNVISTKNIQFETITPNVQVLQLPGTKLTASIRTISGTSVDGSEASYTDLGYEGVVLNKVNNLDSPRIIASKENEASLLNDLPANKSFTLDLELNSINSFLSPVIDLDRVNMVLTSNRLNNPVSNFAQDNSVTITGEDPNAAIYVSKKVELSNPANSIKVLLSAERASTSNIRILYKIFTDDASIDNTPYNLFPGYSNIDDLGNIINESDNDGTSNVLVSPSKPGEFKDYEWLVDDLPEFSAFALKIVMTGTNQATPPIIKELRAIAVR